MPILKKRISALHEAGITAGINSGATIGHGGNMLGAERLMDLDWWHDADGNEAVGEMIDYRRGHRFLEHPFNGEHAGSINALRAAFPTYRLLANRDIYEGVTEFVSWTGRRVAGGILAPKKAVHFGRESHVLERDVFLSDMSGQPPLGAPKKAVHFGRESHVLERDVFLSDMSGQPPLGARKDGKSRSVILPHVLSVKECYWTGIMNTQ